MRTVQRFIRGTRGSAAPTVGAATEEEEMDDEDEAPAEGSSGGTWRGSP